MKEQTVDVKGFYQYLKENSENELPEYSPSAVENLQNLVAENGEGKMSDELKNLIEKITNTVKENTPDPTSDSQKVAPGGSDGPTVQDAINDCFAKVLGGQNFGLVDEYCSNYYGISYFNLLFMASLAIFAGTYWWFSTSVGATAAWMN